MSEQALSIIMERQTVILRRQTEIQENIRKLGYATALEALLVILFIIVAAAS